MDSTDISDKPRRFRVFFDKNVVGEDEESEITTVPPGEDVDAWCSGVLTDMINNTTYNGWDEVES